MKKTGVLVFILLFMLIGCEPSMTPSDDNNNDQEIIDEKDDQEDDDSDDQEEIKNDVEIIFQTNGGSTVNSLSVEEGDSVVLPNDPTRDGYLFDGWYIDNDFTSSFDEGTTVSSNITLYAKWIIEEDPVFDVIFETNGGSVIARKTVEEGDSVVLPNNPTRDGYLFEGWYINSSLSTPFDATNAITSEVTLYAKWIAYEDAVYHVTFADTGDVYIEPIVQLKGQSIGEVEMPIKRGYLFEGWYLDETYQRLFDAQQVHTEDVTLYAKWVDDPSTVKVTFETNGGSLIDPLYVEVNSNVPLPYSTLKDGHVFLKWTYDPEFNQTTFTNFIATEDVTLYAKWYEQPSVVYIFFDSNGGSVVYPYQKRPGQQISTPYPPSKPGYDFVGWFEDEEFTRRYYFNAMGNNDITLYAKWQKVALQEDEIVGDIEDVLTGWDFVCIDHVCELEISTGFRYVFDFNSNTFSHIKHTVEENESGYRYYDSVISIDQHWNVEYSYEVEEDFGMYFETTLKLSGNYLNEEYTVDLFNSSIQSEEARKEAALETIEYFAAFVKRVLEAANLDLIDLE
ncbi:MAG: InlB B-repeat-containing protein [Candidatus Izemoplasmataceae bacterium]